VDSAPAPRASTRLFGGGVAAALGLNVWVSLVIVPGLFVGAFARSQWMPALAAVPLVPLAIGVLSRSPFWLLLGFPLGLLVPVAADVQIVGAHVHGPLTFTLVAVGMCAYLFGASHLASFRETPPPDRMRLLASAAQPVPARWRRRTRLYVALATLSVIFPVALLYAVNFSPANRAALKDSYPERAGGMATLMNLGVLALWLAVFGLHFVGTLKRHRTGDKDLQRDLERIRQRAKRGTPRPLFYVSVVLALGFMALLVSLRYR
jgi:hypothetical protein